MSASIRSILCKRAEQRHLEGGLAVIDVAVLEWRIRGNLFTHSVIILPIYGCHFPIILPFITSLLFSLIDCVVAMSAHVLPPNTLTSEEAAESVYTFPPSNLHVRQ